MTELLHAINKLAVEDSNKSRIIDSGALASYIRLLSITESSTPSPDIESGVKNQSPLGTGKSNQLSRVVSTTETASAEEQFAAVKGIWTLATCKTCCDQVKNYPGCVEGSGYTALNV